jgi:hypothetical protein
MSSLLSSLKRLSKDLFASFIIAKKLAYDLESSFLGNYPVRTLIRKGVVFKLGAKG